jgi:hypothetical protein
MQTDSPGICDEALTLEDFDFGSIMFRCSDTQK